MASKKKGTTADPVALGRYFAGVDKKMPPPPPPPKPKVTMDPTDIGKYFAGVGPMPVAKKPSKVPASNSTYVTATGVEVQNPGQSVSPIPPSVSASGADLKTKEPVKIATPQYVDFNESSLNPISASEYKNLFFEDINGHELLILSNRNFISSQVLQYQPISNMFNFKNTYNPKKIIALQNTSDTYFLNFPIKLDSRIPKGVSSGSTNGTNVYFDSTGNIVVETVNMQKDENVEIQILSNGTIYEDVI